MPDVLLIFLTLSVIIFFGFLAEFLFNKFKIPDVLLLMIFGFILGPYALKTVYPTMVEANAPLFTTFALIFLIFDGAFNIDLVSFVKGLGHSMIITLVNFVISAAAAAAISFAFGFDLLHALLLGFILGGISSAFVIPIIQKLRISKETYSILTLEAAITDVLCIVSTITIIQIITLNSFSFDLVASKLAALFAVAGFFGIVAGIIWIIVINKFFKQNKSYMLTIAYLLLIYTVTEYLHGNGAIAALFFGLVIRNSDRLTSLIDGSNSVSVTSETEKLFYSQISFFLKTFFFVYIGILFDISDTKALILGGVIAVSLLFLRNIGSLFTRGLPRFDRKIINSVFGRGLAAAVLAQVAIQSNVPNAAFISKTVISVVVFSIILSSARIFITSHGSPDEPPLKGNKEETAPTVEKVILGQKSKS